MTLYACIGKTKRYEDMPSVSLNTAEFESLAAAEHHAMIMNSIANYHFVQGDISFYEIEPIEFTETGTETGSEGD